MKGKIQVTCYILFLRRYTGFLAQQCEYVQAVDFIKKFIEKNRELNSAAHPNADFVCGDVMSLEVEDDSFDVIFSNWLLMYLSDDEVQRLTVRLLR